MKYLFTLIALTLVITNCTKVKHDPIKNALHSKWSYNNRIMLENGFYHSYTHFDNIQQKLVGDTLIPFSITDSTIIIKAIVGLGKYVEINNKYEFIVSSDTLITDTLIYEIRNVKKPNLLLYSKNDFYPLIYTLEEEKKLDDVILFDQVEFKVGEYTIGDTISRNLINVKDVSNYERYSFEDIELKSNENISMDIIGDKYILNITQHNISKYDIDDIIRVINAKLGIKPEHSPTKKVKEKELEVEFYTWDKEGISISLQRVKYLGSDSWKKITWKNNWTLYYKNKIIENLLINEFKDSSPKSTIIN